METLANLKAHWKHYAVVALAVLLALGSCYRAGSREATRQDRIGQSLLRLAPGHVPQQSARQVDDRGPGSVDPEPADSLQDTEEPYVAPEAEVHIVPLDPTKPINAKLEYDTWGFCHSLGIEATALPPGLGVDLKWFYYHRWGTTVGANYMTFFGEESASPTLGLTYHFSKTLKNTDFVIGYAPLGLFPAYAGFRVGL